MDRVSIVVDKSMDAGRKANVAAIIMGQLTRDASQVYEDKVTDQSGIAHAGISVNLVVLDGSKEQLLTLITAAKERNIVISVFSSTGQSLSNSYSEYKKQISSMDTRSTQIVGVGLYGEETAVRLLTKKFSLMK
jgi:hypothetical protein